MVVRRPLGLRGMAWRMHVSPAAVLERVEPVATLSITGFPPGAACRPWRLPPGACPQVFEEKAVADKQRYEEELRVHQDSALADLAEADPSGS